ncbi:MAG: hypothetical protein KatS3mg054_0040 [Chloroflexus sp.]|nr:MAG: hypothetical protein KatS3mg054_0040 [Chloroflexus sp.]
MEAFLLGLLGINFIICGVFLAMETEDIDPKEKRSLLLCLIGVDLIILAMAIGVAG